MIWEDSMNKKELVREVTAQGEEARGRQTERETVFCGRKR